MCLDGKDTQGCVSVFQLLVLLLLHQCIHHNSVAWGYYCHAAGRLAAPVLITPPLLRASGAAVFYYRREFLTNSPQELSLIGDVTPWEPQPGPSGTGPRRSDGQYLNLILSVQ